jgi:hypothetical protein
MRWPSYCGSTTRTANVPGFGFGRILVPTPGTERKIFLPMIEIALDRQGVAERGKRLEYFTIAWNSLEGLVAL